MGSEDGWLNQTDPTTTKRWEGLKAMGKMADGGQTIAICESCHAAPVVVLPSP